MFFTDFDRSKMLARQTENLIFWSLSDLQNEIRKNIPRSKKTILLAELFVRYFFSWDKTLEAFLEAILTNDEVRTFRSRFKKRFNCSINDTLYPLWRNQDPESLSASCERLLRRRLAELFDPERTAGFIPVFFTGSEEGYFLPFHLDQGEPGICDLDGTAFAEWTACYSLPCRCVVRCHQRGLFSGTQKLSFTGNSFQFPVYLAWQRRNDPSFPRYNILHLIATGAIADDHLAAVETMQKASAARRTFADATLIFPENDKYFPDRRHECALSCSADLAHVMKQVHRLIEARSLCYPDYSHAIKRLASIDFETRHENFNRWPELLNILENNADAIDDLRDPHGYLLCMMLRSSIYCHMGNTPKALEWNHNAKEFAQKNGFRNELLRLEIEELIEFQDLEQFDVIKDLCRELAGCIETCDNDDLKMRYYGSMGQAHAYGSLSGISGFSRESALECFKTAAACAFRLGSEEDAAQDRNYIHLWHVLFMPGSEAEESAYQQARKHIHNNLRTVSSESVIRKNERFLQRQRAFAGYRSLLKHGVLPSNSEAFREFQLQDPEEDDWLFAVTNKYIGAVTAACGDKTAAEADFKEALVYLPNKNGNPIIAFIRMTILAEAFRSLGKEEDRRKALEAIGALKQTYPASSWKKWEDYLSGHAPFPGLQYWY